MSRYNVMLSYIPLYYHTSRIFTAILAAEGEEFDLLRQNIDDLKAQFFIDTATWGLQFWEKEYGLSINESLTYEERRSRVKGKMRGVGKVGSELIKSVAESYGNGTVEVTFNGSIIVRFVSENGIPSNINDLKQQIEDIKPAHKSLYYRYKFINYEQWQQLTWQESQAMTYNDFLNNE